MVFANDNSAQRSIADDVQEERPQLELVITGTPVYIVGEGVFDNQKQLEQSRTLSGFQAYVPPLAEMGYTPEVMAYLRSPKDCSDRDLWP